MKKNNPSFQLSTDSIEELASSKLTTSLHIGAMLILAGHTDRTGTKSTAGKHAVRTKLGIGLTKAKKILFDLEQWDLITPLELPEDAKRSDVRYIIKDGGDYVWFPKTLVEGYGKFCDPLQKLRRCGDAASRILLYMHLHEDVPGFGGVDPSATFHKRYNCIEQETVGFDGIRYDVKVGKSEGQQAYYSCAEGCGLSCDIDEEGNKMVPRDFWNAIAKLEREGFISETVTIFSGEEFSEMNLLYPLYTFDRFGRQPKGESLASMTATIAINEGLAVVEVDGRFDRSTFAYMADTETSSMVGIYRIRFRDVSKLNRDSAGGWAYIQSCKADWAEVLKTC